jgi:hypothetical protein
MGNQLSIKRVNFEDIQQFIKEKNNYLLINTLTNDLQDCLIPNTINISEEENIINNLINTNKHINIVVYGKNTNDMTIYDKYHQLIKLGFSNIYLYPGGMFEWLCLQDIYTEELFPTNKKQLDILKYKPLSILKTLYITNGID